MKPYYIIFLLSFSLAACSGSDGESNTGSDDNSAEPNTPTETSKKFGLSVSEIKVNNRQTNEAVQVNTDTLKRTNLSLKSH